MEKIADIKQFDMLQCNREDVEVIGMVYRTKDTSMFKTLDGNRLVKENRSGKIAASITSYGNIPNPIIVNERGEIIDGQGRFIACTEILNEPVTFIMVQGLTINECAAMNVYAKNWTSEDWCKMFAEADMYKFPDYIRFMDLHKYANQFMVTSLATIYTAITGSSNLNTKAIQEGTLKITETQCSKGKSVIDIIVSIIGDIPSRYLVKRGGPEKLSQAIAIISQYEGVDTERLYDKILQNIGRDKTRWNSVEECISLIDIWYNQSLSKNKIDIVKLYQSSSSYKRSVSTSNAQINIKKNI